MHQALALRGNCEELADVLRKLSTLIHSLRTALVAEGLIRGGASEAAARPLATLGCAVTWGAVRPGVHAGAGEPGAGAGTA
jgi:hypothetical protein